MSQIRYSSIPVWARPAGGPTGEPEGDGVDFVIVGIGPAGDAVVRGWTARLAGSPVTRIVADELDAADARLREALVDAKVGVRVWICGPVGDCLALRATALVAGLEDDELYIAPTGAGPLDVSCSHCPAVTRADVEVGSVVACSGCGRNLLVYHHVSRRSGTFLGFMVDAEEQQS